MSTSLHVPVRPHPVRSVPGLMATLAFALLAGCGADDGAEAADRIAACPDPDDPAVEYVSQDPDACAVVLFGCEPGQTPFSDECGCGCVDP